MRQTQKVLADRISHPNWDQHRETIHSLYILQNRKLEGPEGVMQVMSRLHDFNATKPQYEARLRSWNIRKKITNREWIVILLHVYARAQHGKKTLVIFNGVLVDEERVAREINRRVSKYNRHLNNLQNPPKLPLGFRLEYPPSSPVLHADNAISGHNPSSCPDLDLLYAIQDVGFKWIEGKQNLQSRLSLFTLTSSDITWEHRIAPERYGKQQRSMLENHSDKSLDFYPSCMMDYANENFADELGDMGPGHHHIKWHLSPGSYQPYSFKDRYDAGFLWDFDGAVQLHHKSWHCNDCSNCQPPSPVLTQCEQCLSTDGTLLKRNFQRHIQLKLVIPGAMLHIKQKGSWLRNVTYFGFTSSDVMISSTDFLLKSLTAESLINT